MSVMFALVLLKSIAAAHSEDQKEANIRIHNDSIVHLFARDYVTYDNSMKADNRVVYTLDVSSLTEDHKVHIPVFFGCNSSISNESYQRSISGDIADGTRPTINMYYMNHYTISDAGMDMSRISYSFKWLSKD